MKYIASEAYGVSSGINFYFYLPDKNRAELPEEYTQWIGNLPEGETLGTYGLFNVEESAGFADWFNIQ